MCPPLRGSVFRSARGPTVSLQGVPEVLDLLLQRSRILGRVLDEVEQEGLHAVRARELRVRVAIEELGDALSAPDHLGGLLLEWRVPARVGVLRRGDVALVL